MTNTKFRKRALLSSIAMLLVAFIALGSATFAWFTDDPTADAKGLTIKASTSTGLVALSDTHAAAKAGDWSHHTVLKASSTLSNGKVVADDTAQELSPVSINASGSVFSGSAADGTAYTGNGAFASTSSGYYTEQIALKVTGGATSATVKVDGVSWTAGTGNLKNAVRVTLFQGSTYLGTWGTSAVAANATQPANNRFISAAGTYSDSIISNRAILAQGADGAATFTCSNDGTTKVTAYFYLDGEHADCFTDNITSTDATLLANNFDIDFAIVTGS